MENLAAAGGAGSCMRPGTDPMTGGACKGRGRPWLALLLPILLLLCQPRFVQAAGEQWTPIGPYGGSVFSMARDPHDQAKAYAGTYFGGLYQSLDGGISWEHIPSPFSRAAVFAIAVDPAVAGILYVGTLEDGIYKSIDGGLNWSQQNTGLTDTIVEGLAIDPFNHDVILAATTSGVFRSVDGGLNWTLSNGGLPVLPAITLAFDPTQQGVVYVGSVEDTLGVLRSQDGGQTWQVYNQGLNGGVLSLHFDQQTGTRMYVTTTGAQAFARFPGDGAWTFISPGLGPVGDILAHPRNNDRLYAATEDGVFVSDDSGSSWRQSLPLSLDEQARWLMADAQGDIIHVATLRGPGMMATMDDGANWFNASYGMQNQFIGGLSTATSLAGTAIFAGSIGYYGWLDGDPNWSWSIRDKEINDVQPDPLDRTRLYAGTLIDGVWTSQDGGATWSQTSDGIFPHTIHTLRQSVTAPYILYAATSYGAFASSDNGLNWHTALLVTHLPADIFSIAVDPDQPEVAYLGARGVLYKTTDALLQQSGTNPLVTSGLPTGTTMMQLELINIPGGQLLLGVAESGVLYGSQDGGNTWSPLAAGLFAVSIAVTPGQPRRIYLGTDTGVYKSDGLGQSWQSASLGLDPGRVEQLALGTVDRDRLYAATANGVYRSDDAAASWSLYDNGLPAGAVTQQVLDPNADDTVYVSVTGQGSYRTNDAGLTWQAMAGNGLAGGEATALLVHRANPGVLYAGTHGGGVTLSFDAGDSWLRTTSGMSLWIRRLAVHPVQTNVLYAAALSNGVFKSIDGGLSWRNIGLEDVYMLDVAVDPVDPDTVYVASTGGIWKTSDGGGSWNLLGDNVFFTTFAIDPQNTSTIYAATEGQGLWKSLDAGLSWFPIDNGFTDTTAYAMAIDPGNPQTVYVGAVFSGVWITEDGGQNWRNIANGMFNTFVLDLALDAGNPNIIYAGTEGGGIFRLVRP